MKGYLLACLLSFLSVPAWPAEAPKEFKNPIFNDILWASNWVSARDMRVTPNYIDTSRSDLLGPRDIPYEEKFFRSHECEYITEDDKGVLLKCETVEPLWRQGGGDYISYEFIFIRYRRVYSAPQSNNCRVWNCTFSVDEGKVQLWGQERKHEPSPLYSKIYKCDDEELDSFESPKEPPECYDELIKRGWDKYIPGELPDFAD